MIMGSVRPRKAMEPTQRPLREAGGSAEDGLHPFIKHRKTMTSKRVFKGSVSFDHLKTEAFFSQSLISASDWRVTSPSTRRKLYHHSAASRSPSDRPP